MIIVVQSLIDSLNSLRRYLEVLGIKFDNFFFTNSHEEALLKVREQKDLPGRTVVVSSKVFYSRGWSGEVLAKEVNAIDPNAWFFIYSSIDPEWTEYIHGYLDKMHGQASKQRQEFFATNFDEIGTLEELWARMPWLRRAWMRAA